MTALQHGDLVHLADTRLGIVIHPCVYSPEAQGDVVVLALGDGTIIEANEMTMICIPFRRDGGPCNFATFLDASYRPEDEEGGDDEPSDSQ